MTGSWVVLCRRVLGTNRARYSRFRPRNLPVSADIETIGPSPAPNRGRSRLMSGVGVVDRDNDRWHDCDRYDDGCHTDADEKPESGSFRVCGTFPP